MKRFWNPLRGDARGFSLIEVLVGVVLTTVGIIGLAGLSITVTQANRGATNRTRADQALHEKIEEFQSFAYDDIEDGADDITIGGITFDRTWTVDEDEPMDGVKKIEVVGTWSEGEAAFQTTRMTYIAEPGR